MSLVDKLGTGIAVGIGLVAGVMPQQVYANDVNQITAERRFKEGKKWQARSLLLLGRRSRSNVKAQIEAEEKAREAAEKAVETQRQLQTPKKLEEGSKDDLRVKPIHVTITSKGTLIPERGYEWINPKDKDDLRIQRITNNSDNGYDSTQPATYGKNKTRLSTDYLNIIQDDVPPIIIKDIKITAETPISD